MAIGSEPALNVQLAPVTTALVLTVKSPWLVNVCELLWPVRRSARKVEVPSPQGTVASKRQARPGCCCSR
jgi:hypothetical protein